VWHEGEARILGSEIVMATPLPHPGAVTTTPATASGAPSSVTAPPVASSSSSSLTAFGKKKGDQKEQESSARRYVIESTNFRLASVAVDGYSAWSNQSDKRIQHGAVAIITVEDGEVAVVRNMGKRQAIGPGRYRLEAPLQVYEKHLYTGVRTSAPEEIVTYDSQRIPIRVKFTVTYEIKEPSRAAQFRGTNGMSDDLEVFLRTACHAALRASVNHTHILEMGKGSELKRMREMEVCRTTLGFCFGCWLFSVRCCVFVLAAQMSESRTTTSSSSSGGVGSLFEDPAATGMNVSA
jgi:hypothetical protein